MELIDTHCHLQFEKLLSDIEGVLARAKKAAVGRVICVGTTLTDSQKAIEIANHFPNVWATVGVHPHDASKIQEQTLAIAGLLKQPRVVAVGEIGLDYFKAYSAVDDQQRVLRQLIEAGLPSGLPFVFHVREAWQDFWPIIDSYQTANQQISGIIHSFSASRRELDEALKRGLLIGLNGIMTFTTDKQQLDAARAVPLDKLVLETDAPFLAPKAYRGQICEPKHTRDIAEFLAKLRDEPLEILAAKTTANAEQLFGLK